MRQFSIQTGNTQLRKIRFLIVTFMVLLILSGLTAFPVQTELNFLNNHFNWFPQFMQPWLARVTEAVNQTAGKYPFLIYGYDWLAYAHIVIALFFVGVYRDPVRNAWVLRTGMLACAGVFVLAFTCASVRGIPFFWTLIDCSFGFFGMIPLVIAHRWINKFEETQKQEFANATHQI
jgi:hypothetical protein